MLFKYSNICKCKLRIILDYIIMRVMSFICLFWCRHFVHLLFHYKKSISFTELASDFVYTFSSFYSPTYFTLQFSHRKMLRFLAIGHLDSISMIYKPNPDIGILFTSSLNYNNGFKQLFILYLACHCGQQQVSLWSNNCLSGMGL